MNILVIASSSSGNAYLISDGISHLLIECGVSLESIKSKIEINLTDLCGCLITHEHKDHSKYADKLLKFCPIYASKGTLEKLAIDAFGYKQNALTANTPTKIGTFTVLPFDVQHDAKEPLGFLIYSSHNNEKLLFATDTYYIKPRFKDLNYIMVECNYASDILEKSNTLPIVRERLIRSHFELGNVKKFLKANDLSKVKKIYLMHLSDGNSDEKRFKKEIMELTGIQVEVCEKG